MNGLNRSQILASLAAVFVAGAAAGVAIGYPLGRKTVLQRPPRPQRDMAAHMLDHYSRELGLSTNQVSQVDPLIQEASLRVRALHKENFRQTDSIMQECNRRIFALLDPAQQQKFREMEERRNKWFRERQAERDRNRTPSHGKPPQASGTDAAAQPSPPTPTPPSRGP